MNSAISEYYATLGSMPLSSSASDRDGQAMSLDVAFDWAIVTARATHAAGNKLMFIGNGGSAGIASHMATDYSKNGGMRSLAFNDGSMLTCLGNDLGYDQVFAKQIDLHAREGDMLIAISSSGKSANILAAVAVARDRGCRVLTLSSFGADNPLRRVGDVNLYVPTNSYGFAEITHLALCHGILDLAMARAAAGVMV